MEANAPPSDLIQSHFLTVEVVDACQADKISMPTPTVFCQSPTSAYLEPPSSLHRAPSSASGKTAVNASPTESTSQVFDESTARAKPWAPGDAFHETPDKLQEPSGSPWEIIYELRDHYDKVMCKAWRDEIDKLIIFAGLFSAVVVAFLAISYPMLKPDPSNTQHQFYVGLYVFWDAAYKAKLNGNILDVQLPAPPNPPPLTVYNPPLSVLRLNSVWFLSLTLALGVVLVGTVCLQWIREYERDTRRGPKEGFAVRQMRFDGLQSWKVPFVIYSLPIILQSSLLLFFWGLLEFLWTTNHVIAMINAPVIAIIFFFVFATISLPTLQCVFRSCEKMQHVHQCAYKSPQARLFALSIFPILVRVIKLIQMIKGRDFLGQKLSFLERFIRGRDWVPFDNAWHKLRLIHFPGGAREVESHDLPQGLAWLATTYAHKTESLQTLHYFMRNLHPSTCLDTLKQLDIPGIMDLQPNWNTPSPRQNDVLADISCAFLLAHQVKSNQLRAYPLLHRRLELLVRIANYSLDVRETREETPIGSFIDAYLSKEPDCAFNPFVPDHDYSALSMLPNIFKQQLLMTFSKYLAVHTLNPVIWSIVKPMTFQTITMTSFTDADLCLLRELSLLNRKLQQYFEETKPKDPSKLDLTSAVEFIRYVGHFDMEIGNHQLSQPCFMEFSDSLRSFKRVLERYIKYCDSAKANFLNEVDSLMPDKAELTGFREYFGAFYQGSINGARSGKPRRLSSVPRWSPFRREYQAPPSVSRALSVPFTNSQTI